MFKFLLPVGLLVFALISTYINHRASYFVHDNHFILLAESFIKNDLFLNPVNLPKGDFADYLGHQYIFYGPTPAIILIPFVIIFDIDFPQYIISIFSLMAVYITIHRLTRKLGFTLENSFWLANFFVFGTVFFFVAVVNISAYLIQAFVTVFAVLSILEYFGKRRWIVIGSLVALAGVTRVNLYGMAVFFAMELFRTRDASFKKNLGLFLVPVVLSVAVLGAYNFRRFGSFTETGYTKHAFEVNDTGNNNKYGYFSIVHAPTKLYLLLFSSPEPVKKQNVEYVLKFPYLKANGYGLAIWFTSPLFLYLLIAKKKPYTLSAVIAIFLLMLPSFLFSGTGSSQYGYRYGLDFIPLLFLVLLSAFPKGLTRFAKILILVGVIFNASYMLSIWNSYPLFFWLE